MLEIKKIKKDTAKFNWDILLIDEAQDWKELERDILDKLFGSQNFVIAYGDKQYLRKNRAISWHEFNENDIPKIGVTGFILISQSGETADTLAALELAKSRGATILGICNVVGSSISGTSVVVVVGAGKAEPKTALEADL